MEENKMQASLISNLLALVSVAEIAVEVRETEIQTGLSNLYGDSK